MEYIANISFFLSADQVSTNRDIAQLNGFDFLTMGHDRRKAAAYSTSTCTALTAAQLDLFEFYVGWLLEADLLV